MNYIGIHTRGGCQGGKPGMVQCPSGPWSLKVDPTEGFGTPAQRRTGAAHYAMNVRRADPGGAKLGGASWYSDSTSPYPR